MMDSIKLKSAMSHCTETATNHEHEVIVSVFIIIIIIIMHVLVWVRVSEKEKQLVSIVRKLMCDKSQAVRGWDLPLEDA